MDALENYFKQIEFKLENSNDVFKENLKKSFLSISRQVSSTTLSNHFEQVAKICKIEPENAAQIINFYLRKFKMKKEENLPRPYKQVIEISLTNFLNHACIPVKAYYSSSADFLFGHIKLQILGEKKQTDEDPNIQGSSFIIKVKEVSLNPSRIQVNYCGKPLEIGQFFEFKKEIMLVKYICADFIVLSLVADGTETEFKFQSKVNYLNIKNKRIERFNPCLNGGFRILKEGDDWYMWGDEDLCLMYLNNPLQGVSQEMSKWVELPLNVSEIWINEQKYTIKIKEY